MGNYTIFQMFENLRRGKQARNFTTNVPKMLDVKSSSEQIFSENCRWMPLYCHCQRKLHLLLQDLLDVLIAYLDSQNHCSDCKNTSFCPCCPTSFLAGGRCAFLICKQNMLMCYARVLYFLQSSE